MIYNYVNLRFYQLHLNRHSWNKISSFARNSMEFDEINANDVFEMRDLRGSMTTRIEKTLLEVCKKRF